MEEKKFRYIMYNNIRGCNSRKKKIENRVSVALKYRRNFHIHKYTIRVAKIFRLLRANLIKAIEEKKFRCS